MSSIPSTSQVLSAELRCQLRPGRTETFRLGAAETVIGRTSGVGITIPADGVSRRHAKITLKGNAYYLENLSQAGTFLNGHRDRQGRLAGLVMRPRRLRHLDVITLAKKVDLLFLLYEDARPKGPSVGIVRAALIPKEGDSVPIELEVGETSLGRSSANNVVVDQSVVSGLHARIERDGQRVVLRDLDSANGTFLNGERATTALLRDGDVVSIANVVSFRVLIETGAVDTGSFRVAEEPAPAPSAPLEPTTGSYSMQWKTRYEWDPSEMKEIAELRAQIEKQAVQKDQAAAKPAQGGHAKPAAPPKLAAAAKPAAPAKPAAAAAKPAASPAPPPKATAAVPPSPAPPATAPAAAVAKPSPPPAPPKAAAATPAPKPAPAPATPPAATAVPPVPAVPPAPKPPVAAPPAVVKPSAPVPPPAPKPPAAAPVPSAPAPIREILLTGPDTSIVISAPGPHDLGRAGANKVNHPTVSRRHARVTLSADRMSLIVEDLGSHNTARHNGEPVKGPEPLADGDTITLGSVTLTVALKRG